MRPTPSWWLAGGLALLALGAAALRLVPLAEGGVWGGDTGQYHRLAEDLLRDGRLDRAAPGWGVAYASFPGLYAVASGLAAMTGLDLRLAHEAAVPALAGLGALGAALLAYRVTLDPRAGLLAGAVLAVAMPHAYFTSNPMPGALGDLLLVGALLLAWEVARDRALWPALAAVLAAVVATHHLTTYMLLLALGGMTAARAFLGPGRDDPGHRALLGALGLTLAMALAWWGWSAAVREGLVRSATPWGLRALGLAAAAGLLALGLLPRLRARWPRRRALPAPAPRVLLALTALGLLGAVAAAWALVPRGPSPTPEGLVWFAPLALLLAFAGPGALAVRTHARAPELYGWTLAVAGSLAVMVALDSRVFFPGRHLQYLAVPASVLAGAGLAGFLPRGRGMARRALPVAGLAALLALNAALAFPREDVHPSFANGVSRAEFEAALWAGEHIALEEGSVIAAPHALSMVLFGYAGLNATYEYALLTYVAPTFEIAAAEMAALDTPSGRSRVDYVVVTESLRRSIRGEGAAHPLVEAVLAKFDGDPHYVAVCRSEEATIYRVDWGLALPRPAAPPPCRPTAGPAA